MPLNLAQRNAWSLARTLMTIVVVFRIEGSQFGVAEAQDFDGDPSLNRGSVSRTLLILRHTETRLSNCCHRRIFCLLSHPCRRSTFAPA